MVNGDFSKFLATQGKLDLKIAQFYSAQIVNILSYLRGKSLAHRDLKPSNILMNENYHLVLGDFGTAKITSNEAPINSESDKGISDTHRTRIYSSNSIPASSDGSTPEKQSTTCNTNDELMSDEVNLVGTEDFIAPETLKGAEGGFAADLWSLGVIIFQMFTGKTPFKGYNRNQTFDKILAGEYKIPKYVPEPARDLI